MRSGVGAFRLVMAMAIALAGVNLHAQAAQQGGSAVTPSTPQASPPPAIRDAREAAPPALIGTWVLNLSKSKFAGTPPRAEIRTFDYSLNGMLLHTYAAVNAAGNNTFGHWFATLDGDEFHPDFLRPSGSTPFMMVGLKKIDEYNIEIVLKQRGTIGSKGMFTLSKDGQTLTRSLTNLTTKATNVAVWDRQPLSQTYRP